MVSPSYGETSADHAGFIKNGVAADNNVPEETGLFQELVRAVVFDRVPFNHIRGSRKRTNSEWAY